MKKLYLPLLLLLILSLLLSGCGEYTRPPVSGTITPGGDDAGDPPDDPGGDETEEEPFTVSLSFSGAAFVPAQPISAQWSDGYSYHQAAFDEYGEARITGLDGDYQVTLTGLPTGYTYNPNIYRANNDNRHVTIELHQLGTTRKNGTDLYDKIINLQKMGVYRATLTEDGSKIDPTTFNTPNKTAKGEIVFFQFVPKQAGTYAIESWMDITANLVNPIIEVYYGSAVYKTYGYAVDGGGVEGNYTKNFRCEVDVDDEQIGMVFAFGIRVTSKIDTFPVTVDFSLQYEGAYDVEYKPGEWMMADELYGHLRAALLDMQTLYPTFEAFWNAPIFGGASFADQWNSMREENETDIAEKQAFYTSVYKDYHRFIEENKLAEMDSIELTAFLNAVPYVDEALTQRIKDQFGGSGTWKWAEDVIGGQNFFLSSNYAFNPATGFYHRYDATAFADDPYGYGAGYGPILYAKIAQATRFIGAEENRTSFISIEYYGNKALTVSNGKENYKLVIEGYDYAESTSLVIYGADGCGAPAELVGAKGYNDYVNGDGVVPVTQELKDFLQKYSVSQRLFNDGNGYAEITVQPTFDAGEYDQWLFACGYYL